MTTRKLGALTRALTLIALIATFLVPLPAAAQPGEATGTCVQAPSGITSWWQGEGNANDIVGSNNGTLQGATFTAGEVGQAFQFDGTSDIQIPDSDSLQISSSSPSTLDAWIN